MTAALPRGLFGGLVAGYVDRANDLIVATEKSP